MSYKMYSNKSVQQYLSGHKPWQAMAYAKLKVRYDCLQKLFHFL